MMLVVTVWLGVLVSESSLSNDLSGFGSVVGCLFEAVGRNFNVFGGDEWDLNVVGIVGILVDGSGDLSVNSVGLLVEDGALVILLSIQLLGVVFGALDELVSEVCLSAVDSDWDSGGRIGWDLFLDGVLLILEGGDWNVFLGLEGLLVSDGSWNLSLDLVLLGVVFSHGVVLGDGVWNLSGALDLLLLVDGLWLLLVVSVGLSSVLGGWDLDFNFVVLVLVDDVGLLLVDGVWNLGGGGVWDLLGDGVWDLLVNGVGLGVVLNAVFDVAFLILDDSWDLDLSGLWHLADNVSWDLLGGPVLLFLVEAIIR